MITLVIEHIHNGCIKIIEGNDIYHAFKVNNLQHNYWNIIGIDVKE